MKKPNIIEIKKINNNLAEVTFHEFSNDLQYEFEGKERFRKKRYRKQLYSFVDRDNLIRMVKKVN